MISAFGAGRDALRWVTDAAVPAAGGLTWPETRTDGAPSWDNVYDGTAGVLYALAEARLSGITDFDQHASAAAGRLRGLVASQLARGITPDRVGAPYNGLYTGLSGYVAALYAWAAVSGDRQAARAARAAVHGIAGLACTGQPVSAIRDLLSGEAGILLVLTGIGGADAAGGGRDRRPPRRRGRLAGRRAGLVYRRNQALLPAELLARRGRDRLFARSRQRAAPAARPP